jgi:hypothetical protein
MVDSRMVENIEEAFNSSKGGRTGDRFDVTAL